MIRYKKFILLFTLFCSLLACDKTETATTQKNPSSNTTTSSSQIVNSNTQFALDLYKTVVDETENQILSPYSISTALAMVYAGTDGNTATEIQNVFGFGANNSSFHQAFNQTTNSIETNISTPTNSELNVVNKIWRSPIISFLSDFENTMNTDYLAPVDVTDFTNAPVARQLINSWVDHETNSLIPDLIPDGFINNNTATVLVNAIYFKADWAHQFSTHSTYPRPFTTSDNSTVNTDMMGDLIPTNELKFTEDAEAEVLELFFEDNKSSILIILPKNQGLGIDNFVQQKLTKTRFDNWLNNLATPNPSSNFNVSIPKFGFGSDFDLVDHLKTLGIHDAFSEMANLSKMAHAPLFIDKIKHKAVIKADEGGVEAAGSTAVGIGLTSVPPIAKTIIANRPFVFVVKETESNSVLFIGHVQDPS